MLPKILTEFSIVIDFAKTPFVFHTQYSFEKTAPTDTSKSLRDTKQIEILLYIWRKEKITLNLSINS